MTSLTPRDLAMLCRNEAIIKFSGGDKPFEIALDANIDDASKREIIAFTEKLSDMFMEALQEGLVKTAKPEFSFEADTNYFH